MTEVGSAVTGVVKDEVNKVVTGIKQIPTSIETARVWSLWSIVISFVLSIIGVIWYFFELINSQLSNSVVRDQYGRLVIIDAPESSNRPDLFNAILHFASYIAMIVFCIIGLRGIGLRGIRLCSNVKKRGKSLAYVLLAFAIGAILEIVCLFIGLIIQQDETAKPDWKTVVLTILVIISYLVSAVCLFYYQSRIDPVQIEISEMPPKIQVKELAQSPQEIGQAGQVGQSVAASPTASDSPTLSP